MKKALLLRYGAYGDGIILSPVIRALKKQGYYVILQVSERCEEIYRHDKNVDELLFYKSNSVEPHKLDEYWKKLRDYYQPDYFKNFCESIEVALAIHPRDGDRYDNGKEQRRKECNKNYYEFALEFAGLKGDPKGHIYLTRQEEKFAKKQMDDKKFNVVIGLMGSGHNKLYPWNVHMIPELYRQIPDINIITVGCRRCVDIENAIDAPISKFSNRIDFRRTVAMAKYADLVIAPDTGLLHAAGCFSTPKIGLLGHTTIENITKHFENDYSIEAECDCAPCFKLIYDYKIQCPIDRTTNAPLCMGYGISPFEVIGRVKEIYKKHYKKEN